MVLEREISCSQWEGSACTHEKSNFFLSERRDRSFLFFSLVLNVFPSCSHKVPIKFPNLFLRILPIAPWFYPIWFLQSFNSHEYKPKKGCQRETCQNTFIYGRKANLGLLCCRVPNFPKILMMGPINGSFLF